MKAREIVLIVVALLAGFALGRVGRDPASGTKAGGASKSIPDSGGSSSLDRPAMDPGERDSPGASRPRRDRPAEVARNKSSEPRVSIPLKTVAGLLKDELSYSDFIVLGRKMEPALVMLGASEQEKKDVMAAINKNQAALLAEEKTHVKVASSDGSKITLDLSGMEEPARRIAGQLQEDLRAALPEDIAGALIGSMDFNRYYFSGEARETSFRITRGDSGGLMATQATGGGSNGMGINPKEHADDGAPIPAAAVFDKRWSTWLEGVELTPPAR